MRLFIVSFLLTACSGSPPIDVGTSWTMNTTSETTQTSYWLRQGAEEPTESIGPLGESSSCILAETSAGTSTSISSGEYVTKSSVLGSTEVYHPLVPNSEDYSSMLASVVQESTSGGEYTSTTSVDYDPDSTLGNSTTTTYADSEIETEATFHGISADEYVVRFGLGNIWLNPEEDVTIGNVELLTRSNPDLGDIWASENGNTIYASQGVEQVSFAGLVKKANKIEMYEVGNLQDEGGDILEQCLNIGLSQNQTTDPDSSNSSQERVFVDPGCQGDFEHVKTGTQWWYDSVLVKESSTVQRIEITRRGYEWFETDSTGSVCTRIVSDTKDSPNAILFVEYDLIVETIQSGITSWSE
jgi:hypothetical protein